MCPAVWQRLPDIKPNYGQVDRRSKLLSASRSHEASVIIRDNVSTAHQLSLQLSTLTIERLKTIRLLNTNKQTFIARQSVKQRYLERSGITEVSLLPRRLMLLTTLTSPHDENKAKSRDTTAKRQHVIAGAASTRSGNSFPIIINEHATEAGHKMAGSQRDTAKGVRVSSPNVSPEVESARRPVKFQPLTSFADGTAVDAPFLTHNFRRHPGTESNESDDSPHSPPIQVDTELATAAPKAIQVPGAETSTTAVDSCHTDHRFLSLMSSLSSRSPSGVDSYIQLSPSGSHVLGLYAKPQCDLNRVRQAIDANQGTARLRYVRAVTAGVQGSSASGAALGRARRHGRVIDASELLIRSTTEIVQSFKDRYESDEPVIQSDNESATAWNFN